MRQPNLKLKALIIQCYGKVVDAARDFDMREDRLSRVIHRRVNPSPAEQQKIADAINRMVSLEDAITPEEVV